VRLSSLDVQLSQQLFPQLVESATSDSSNDAFNFLSQGAGKIVFEVFLKLYIGVIFVVLVCSLGNRPQGSKWTYSISMILFGFCNIITLWCAGYTVYLAVPHTLDGWKNFPEYDHSYATWLYCLTFAFFPD
jgi:chitin synthase